MIIIFLLNQNLRYIFQLNYTKESKSHEKDKKVRFFKLELVKQKSQFLRECNSHIN